MFSGQGVDRWGVVAAPTGLAAFNVCDLTIHRLFQLPIEHEGKTAEYWSLSKESHKVMKTKLRDVKLIIVDEISIVSSLNWAWDWKNCLVVTTGSGVEMCIVANRPDSGGTVPTF